MKQRRKLLLLTVSGVILILTFVYILPLMRTRCNVIQTCFCNPYVHIAECSQNASRLRKGSKFSHQLHTTGNQPRVNRLPPKQNTGYPALHDTGYPLTIGRNVYTINNVRLCSDVRDLLLLVLIHTSTVHFQRRKTIRQTWANINMLRTYNMRVVFLLGKHQNSTDVQTKIQQESDMYGDIVQGNFVDSYHNLTHKAVLGLRWVTENCRHAKFILKVDDDVFVKIFLLINDLLRTYAKTSRTIACNMRGKGKWKIHRDGKWAVDRREFVNMAKWPFNHCPGYIVLLTADIVPELYKAATKTAFLWLDDVYITGLLAEKAGNIMHTMLKNLGRLAGFVQSDHEMHEKWNKSLIEQNELAVQYLKLDNL